MGRKVNSGLSKGVIGQLDIENYELIDKLNIENIDNQTCILYGNDAVEELMKAKVKFDRDNIIFVAKNKNSELMWLENGNFKAGLNHIMIRHDKDFCRAFNIKKNEITNKLIEVINSWHFVGRELKDIDGINGFEYEYENDGNYVTILAVGTNGFIVSAYPRRRKK